MIMEYPKIIKVSRNLHQNNSETVTNENDEEVPKEKCMSEEKIQKTIDNLDINIKV